MKTKKPSGRECTRFNRDVATLRKVFLEQPEVRSQLLTSLAGLAKQYAPQKKAKTRSPHTFLKVTQRFEGGLFQVEGSDLILSNGGQ